MFVTILGVLLTLVALVYAYLTWSFNYWTSRSVPGPKPTVLLGNLPNTFLGRRNLVYDYDDIYRKYKDHTSFVGMFSVRQPQLLVTDGEAVKDILVKHFKNFSKNDFTDFIDKDTDPLFGRNPFMLQGEEWKEKRGEITPAFTVNRLKACYPLIEEVCQRLTNYLRENTDQDLDLKELAAKYTTDVVSNTVFSTDAQSFKSEKPLIREMGRKVVGNMSFLLYAYVILLVIFPSISKVLRLPFVSKDVEHFFTNLMSEAIDYRQKNDIKRADFMEYLLQLQKTKSLTNLEMAAHSITFFLDGFETSSIFISNVLFELSQNPDVQTKLREEIRQSKTSKGGLTYDTIAELEYLDQVCHETLRMHPPAPLLGKKCSEPIELTINRRSNQKLLVEKGMSVFLPMYSISRDPAFFENPNSFDPDRFSAENGGVKYYKDKGVFFPFGDGPRICLGMRFAMAQSKAAIVEVVENFELLKSNKVKLPLKMVPFEFLNIPVGGVWAKFRPVPC